MPNVKLLCLWTVALWLCMLVLWPSNTRSAELSGREIMEKNFYAGKVQHLLNQSTMTLTNDKGQQRIRKMRSASVLQPNGIDSTLLIRFLFPGDVKGTGYLQIQHHDREDDMWVYLPALKKVRRLVASNKKDSFVGTDFSYGDVIGHKVEEWTHRLLREETVDGAACYVIESLPRSDTVANNSGYSKRMTWVRKDNFVSPRAEFWDTAGQPLKRIAASDIRPAGKKGHWQPMITEAENLQSGHKTIVRLDRFDADASVEASLFTTRY